MPVVTDEQQTTKRQRHWRFVVAVLSPLVLALGLLLIPLFKRVEFTLGKVVWTALVMDDENGFALENGFYHSDNRRENYEYWILRMGTWEYRVFRSVRSR